MDGIVCKIKFSLIKPIGLLLLCSFSLLGLNAFSQSKEAVRLLKGQVIELETGQALLGANVWLKETSVGAIADVDGNFQLNVPAGRSFVLTISYIGYETKEHIISATDDNVVIDLSLESGLLEEVQVIGYGTQRKESIIGSITTIKPKELSAPIGSISTNLAGKLGGIVSIQRSGEPGASSQFWIRGISTFGANKNPLILVDGIERSLDLLDTEEIESFSLLKDATATAVYGVRGANGVLLITTRRGAEGKPRISVKAESGRVEFTKIPKMANSVDYAMLYNEMKGYDVYSPEIIELYQNQTDPDLYPSVDWIDTIFKNYSLNQRVTANVTGGGAIARYFISTSFYHENGMFSSDGGSYNGNPDYKRYNFRSNVDVNLSPSTVLALTLGGFLQQNQSPARTSRIWELAFTLQPNSFPIKYSNGFWSGKSEVENPYYMITESGYASGWNNTLNSVVSLEQDFGNLITPGLKAALRFSFDANSAHTNQYTKQDDVYHTNLRDEDGELIFGKPSRTKGGPWYDHASSGSSSTYIEGSINYNRLFGSHRVGGLLLYNQRVYKLTSSSSLGSLPYKQQGIAGRVTYDYDSRYFVEGNFGYNGSENFAPGHRVGLFPSIALGWYASNEEFFEPFTDVISKLKFKTSLGQVGNDKIEGVRFIYLGTVAGSGTYVYGSNYTAASGERVHEVPNPYVSWEVSTKQNYGVELGLFNKLDIQADWFQDTRDRIFVRNNFIPAYVGLSTVPMVNVGKMKSWGFDTTLEYNHQIRDWFLSARGTFTYASNIIVENSEPSNRYPYMDTKGQKIYQNRGFVALGLFESYDEIDRSPIQFSEAMHSSLRPGDVKYQDINGDGVIDNFDIIPIGLSDIPEITYGFGVSIGWKNMIDCSVFLQGSERVTCFEEGWTFAPFTSGYADHNGFNKDVVGKHWSLDNPDPHAKYPRLNDIPFGSNNNTKRSTFWQRDASYIRLKNAELGFTIPKKTTNMLNLQAVRVFFSGVNLLTFSKELKLYDPELGTTDGRLYPPTRIYNIGMNINF